MSGTLKTGTSKASLLSDIVNMRNSDTRKTIAGFSSIIRLLARSSKRGKRKERLNDFVFNNLRVCAKEREESKKGIRQLEKLARRMKTIELEFEKRCRAEARRRGWVCCKLEKNGCKGIPDDLFISPSQKCVLIEFKKDEKQKPRPEQKVWLQRFDRIAFLVGSYQEFERILAENE